MKLLHVVATPRADGSNTLRISHSYLEAVRAEHPDVQIETLNLFTTNLLTLEGQNLESKYSLMIGQPLDPEHVDSWEGVEALITQFLAADICLISAPMWNLSIPYALKYYIDAIVQPGYLFSYNEQGVPVGCCEGKELVCITTRGGDYSVGSPMHAFDLQESYLRAIFGFVGISDIQFVHAQPMDIGSDLREAAIGVAIGEVRALVAEVGGRPGLELAATA